MRRKEFSISEEGEITEFLHQVSYGYLGVEGDDGWPLVLPLNFVYYEGAIYFHGSRHGGKMKQMAANPRVTFSVAKEYALIPSYFTDDKLACPATAFFKSVFIKGYAAPVEDLPEKARVFTAFMEKLQPEGGYAAIDPQDKEYRGNLRGVALVKITIEEMTAKFKFGQNWTPEAHEKVREQLIDRGRPADLETARMMEKYRPAAN